MKRTAKLLAVVSALLMLVGIVPVCAAPSADAQTIVLADAVDSVKLLGRTTADDSGIEPHGTGAGIAFYAECDGDITLKVTAKPAKFESVFLAVFVDGEMTRVEFKSAVNRKDTQELTIAENLDAGKHLIEIVRETEETYGSCVFEELVLNGTIAPVENKSMLIEFIGDSMTAGYASYPETDENKSLSVEHPAREAGVNTYAYLTAQKLNADFSAVCASGYGVVKGWNGDRVTLSKMYDYAGYYHNKKEDGKWAFDRTADVVVINLGTNDNSRGTKPAEMEKGAKELMEQVREHNPDAAVVWVTGLMGDVFVDDVQAAIDALGGAEKGFYFATLPKGTSGGAGHPSLEEHETAAEALVKFLKDNGLVKEDEQPKDEPAPTTTKPVTTSTSPVENPNTNDMTLIVIVIAVAVVLLAGIAVVTAVMLKKK